LDVFLSHNIRLETCLQLRVEISLVLGLCILAACWLGLHFDLLGIVVRVELLRHALIVEIQVRSEFCVHLLSSRLIMQVEFDYPNDNVHRPAKDTEARNYKHARKVRLSPQLRDLPVVILAQVE
jgi:hypothetical protein